LSVKIILAALLIYLAAPGCKKNTPDKNEDPLARVYDKYLYTSDIRGLLHENTSPEDSARIVDEYIDNWIRRNLVLKVAEDNLQSSIEEINRQVEDSRQSLILYAYEKQWLKENLDTIVSADSVREYFDHNSADFVLKNDIYKLSYAVVPKNLKSADSINFWFSRGIEKFRYELERYCAANCSGFSFNSGIWLNEDDLFNLLPYDMYAGGKFRTKGVVQWSDSANRYFVKVDDYYISGGIAPFEYSIESVKDIIINRRKMTLLKNTYQEIYSEGLKRNNAEILKKEE